MTQPVILVSQVIGGICNRIKSLVSALRINPNSRVIWCINLHCGCFFDDLFTNDIQIYNLTVDMQDHSTWRFDVLDTDVEIYPGFSTIKWNLENNGRCLDLEYQKIPTTMRQKYLDVLSTLQIQPVILDKVSSFWRDNSPPTVSVHIRTWKTTADDPLLKNSTQLCKFIECMKTFSVETTFLVSSDSDDSITYMKQTFPGRIIQYSRTTIRHDSRTTREGQVEDFIELLLLSKSKVLIGTYGSTYSELAWWFGGCVATVIIPDILINE